MQRRRRILNVAAVIGIALVVGHVTQQPTQARGTAVVTQDTQSKRIIATSSAIISSGSSADLMPRVSLTGETLVQDVPFAENAPASAPSVNAVGSPDDLSTAQANLARAGQGQIADRATLPEATVLAALSDPASPSSTPFSSGPRDFPRAGSDVTLKPSGTAQSGMWQSGMTQTGTAQTGTAHLGTAQPVSGLQSGQLSEPVAAPQFLLVPTSETAETIGASGDLSGPVGSAEISDAGQVSAAVREVPAGGDCVETLFVEAGPGALLDVTLHAPCRSQASVVLRHAGLAVGARIDAEGWMRQTLPALADPAEVTLMFLSGKRLTAATSVPDLARYDRVAVQWLGADAFALQAYHGNAEFGGAGHLSAKTPGYPEGPQGHLLQLGDAAADRVLMAEVFTYPSDLPTPVIEIEATVTNKTCGREVLAETLNLRAGRVTVLDLSIQMPGCDAVGDFLVLQNPVLDLTLASD